LRLLELRNNLFLDPAKLRELQWRKLKTLVKHSYENVPFYHRKFDHAGIKPEHITGFEDLSKIPLTTREELQRLPLGTVTARDIDIEQCEKTTTSGTTGTPLTLILDRESVECGNAMWIRALERDGLKNRDKMAVIRHPGYFPKVHWFQRIGIRPRKNISALDNTERQITVLEKYCPQAIKGYSSSLWEIARTLEHRPHQIKPRLTFSGGELMSSQARKSITTSFDTEVFDNYGTTEFSLIAWECKEHIGYHINTDSLLIEFLDGTGESVLEGKKGAVVCTGLHNYAMPLIRYKGDDIAVPMDVQCPCGVKLPLLKGIEGRQSDLLITLDGRSISPWRFFPYPFDDYAGIIQFTITQERRDRIVFRLVLEDTFDMSRLDEARQRIKDLFGEEMQIDFRIIDKFDREKSGKIRAISRLF